MSSRIKPKVPYLRSLLFVLLLIVIVSVLAFYARYLRVEFTQAFQEEITEPLSNPWQGFYHIRGYVLSDTEPTEETLLNDINSLSSEKLYLLQINLRNYKEQTLTEAALERLKTILSVWSQSDRQLILRFLYDWDGKASEHEPESIDIVLNHISAAGPIVNQYSHSVYLLQGLFVGNYGEMHGSNFHAQEDIRSLASQLADSVSPDIYLSVRTPAQLRTILETGSALTQSEAFSGTMAARLGLFNDGMLGSSTDVGTYADKLTVDTSDYTKIRDRENELQFQEQLNCFVPNGGEVILENPYNDLEPAIIDLARMHVSYLNADYDGKVLDKWKSSTYQGDDLFKGCSGYDYIHAHLGYRYRLGECRLQFHPVQDSEAILSLTLENIGFSTCYRPLEAMVLLYHTETGESSSYLFTEDLRFLSGNSSMELNTLLPVRELEKGTYQIYLKIQDVTTKQEIQLAHLQQENGYLLGTMILHSYH